MMNNRNFLYNIDQLQQLFKNNISVVLIQIITKILIKTSRFKRN